MIGRLRGNVTDQHEDGSVLLDVGGVGYEVFVPLGALGRASVESGEVTLRIHTHMRAESLTLYGFPSDEDRQAFRALLGVASIGPKLAMAIMGRMDSGALHTAVARQDKAAFKGISGVGKKTVERLLIDLQGKLRRNDSNGAAQMPPMAAADLSLSESAIRALIQMGYKRGEAQSAVDQIVQQSTGSDVESILRAALVSLS